MIGEYTKTGWFWEFVKMNLKLIVMCCLVFFENDIPNKVFLFQRLLYIIKIKDLVYFFIRLYLRFFVI